MPIFSSPVPDRRMAFTLTEVMVAVGVIGILFVSLYLAFSAGFSMVRMSRENQAATEVMVERAETLRQYTWSQFNDPNFFRTNFVGDTNSMAALGTIYYGTIEQNPPSFPDHPNYENSMRLVTISVRWTNTFGKPLPHYRAMQTLVAKNGVSN